MAAASQGAKVSVAGNRMLAFILIALSFIAGVGVYSIVGGVNRILRDFAGQMRDVTVRVAGAATQVSFSSMALARVRPTRRARSIALLHRVRRSIAWLTKARRVASRPRHEWRRRRAASRRPISRCGK